MLPSKHGESLKHSKSQQSSIRTHVSVFPEEKTASKQNCSSRSRSQMAVSLEVPKVLSDDENAALTMRYLRSYAEFFYKFHVKHHLLYAIVGVTNLKSSVLSIKFNV